MHEPFLSLSYYFHEFSFCTIEILCPLPFATLDFRGFIHVRSRIFPRHPMNKDKKENKEMKNYS